MTEVADTSNCGVKEIENLGESLNTQEVIATLLIDAKQKRAYPNKVGRMKEYTHFPAVYTFSDARHGTGGTKPTYALRLMEYVRRKKLGKVVVAAKAVNPNTGNTIQHYVWTVNQPAMMKLLHEHVKGESCTLRGPEAW